MRAVVWIMVKRKPSATEPDAGRPALETQTYFSTLEYAAVPSAPTDLFVPLVRQLEEDWAGVYAAANEHLDSMVPMSFDFKIPANRQVAYGSVRIKLETHQISLT